MSPVRQLAPPASVRTTKASIVCLYGEMWAASVSTMAPHDFQSPPHKAGLCSDFALLAGVSLQVAVTCQSRRLAAARLASIPKKTQTRSCFVSNRTPAPCPAQPLTRCTWPPVFSVWAGIKQAERRPLWRSFSLSGIYWRLPCFRHNDQLLFHQVHAGSDAAFKCSS